LRVHEQDLAVLVHRRPGVRGSAFPRVHQERERARPACQQLRGHVAHRLLDLLSRDCRVLARDDRAQRLEPAARRVLGAFGADVLAVQRPGRIALGVGVEGSRGRHAGPAVHVRVEE